MNRFAGKTAFVTGGARGLGAATARRIADEGGHAVIADLAGAGGDALAAQIGGTAVTLDVTDEHGWAAALEDIIARHGRLDVLVNAAGIVGNVVEGTLETTTLAEWRRVLAVNLDGTFLGCRAVMGPMKAAGGGAIVNVASLGSYYPTIQSVAYGASKGAVMQLTKSVALEGSQGPSKVRCNSVHPGMIATAMLDTIIEQMASRGGDAKAIAQAGASNIPLGGAGKAEDVAALIAFLASDEATYITGSEYVVDGGWKLRR